MRDSHSFVWFEEDLHDNFEGMLSTPVRFFGRSGTPFFLVAHPEGYEIERLHCVAHFPRNAFVFFRSFSWERLSRRDGNRVFAWFTLMLGWLTLFIQLAFFACFTIVVGLWTEMMSIFGLVFRVIAVLGPFLRS